MRLIFTFSVLVLLGTLALADVVRPAPEFTWADAGGKNRSLSDFRNQPVVLLFAASPRDRRFKAQLRELRPTYERLAAQKVIFAVAFTEETGSVPSNIPFVIVNNGPQVAAAYNIRNRFAIGVIGRDGNLDYVTDRVVTGQRVLDIVDNSFVNQSALRRE